MIAAEGVKTPVQAVAETGKQIVAIVLEMETQAVQLVLEAGRLIVLRAAGQVIDITTSHGLKVIMTTAREAQSIEPYTKM